MPVNPLLAANLRRYWQLIGALLVVLVLLILHGALFLPTQARYARAIASLGGVDAVLDPSRGSAPIPPRVFALIGENAMPAEEATQRATSGQITTMMLEDLSALASRSGLTVTLSEPGPITPLPTRVETRVHLRVRGGYPQVVEFLRAMERSGRLYDVERYQITGLESGALQMELMVTRLLLKQSGAAG